MSEEDLREELHRLRHDLADARHDREKVMGVVLKLIGREQLERALAGDDHEGLGLEDLAKEKRKEVRRKKVRNGGGRRR